MKKSDIFAAVVVEPSFMSKQNLLGKPLDGYLKDELSEIPHAFFDCKKQITRPNCKYFCLLYADMPLVTADMLLSAAESLKRRNIGAIGLGEGYMTREGADAEIKYYAAGEYFLRVNDTSSLNLVYNELKRRRLRRLLESGVTVLGDAEVDFTSQVEKGAVLKGHVRIVGKSLIKSGAVITDSTVEDSEIGENTTVGPYSYVRAGSKIGKNCRIGDFVEVKSSELGVGVKAAHLAYIGNAEVGDGTNVGCGAVFCNYDGIKKHKTSVGKGVFLGANVNLVAPLTVGDGAYVAAGSTITEDLPENCFSIARERQTVKQTKKT